MGPLCWHNSGRGYLVDLIERIRGEVVVVCLSDDK
jgi:hypothetical protein